MNIDNFASIQLFIKSLLYMIGDKFFLYGLEFVNERWTMMHACFIFSSLALSGFTLAWKLVRFVYAASSISKKEPSSESTSKIRFSLIHLHNLSQKSNQHHHGSEIVNSEKISQGLTS